MEADLKTYDFGVVKWDLVAMIYAPDERALVERARKSMKPGGLFVLEHFAHGDPDGEGSFAQGELAGLFQTASTSCVMR